MRWNCYMVDIEHTQYRRPKALQYTIGRVVSEQFIV